MKYRLDELGWLQFENLVQSLLKASLGLGVENWSGSGDHGRDHFCQSQLRFPGKEVESGPFLFQSKFISGANGAGSNFAPGLISAVKSEKARIENRREKLVWDDPRHYVLVTNCPVSPMHREQISNELSSVTEGVVSILGASDLEGMLAAYPEVRNSFPQILGLGDLSEILLTQVNKEIRERSSAAISAASGIERVFVPTAAFALSQRILAKHRFCVLEGPPEVGKTAIARMLGILKILGGWEVIECKAPADFYSTFDGDKRQFFIADDAFGRTEFDPSMGREWERELENILFRLDADHELCWTSRKHILERALRKMDLQGKAKNFPKPSAVMVDAARLTLQEKTLILLRHAQDASLTPRQVTIARKNSTQIVASNDFTPERIRRFVNDVLPDLEKKEIDEATIAEIVMQAIKDPTISMRKSFGGLSPGHRLLLYVIIEQDWFGEVSELRVEYEAAATEFGATEPFDQVVEELVGTFIRYLGDGDYLDWIHPSVRDMVIDELSGRQSERWSFLRRGGARCFSLALSELGGKAGARIRPLLRGEHDWRLLMELQARVVSCHSKAIHQIVADLLEVGRESLSNDERAWFENLVRDLFLRLRESIDSGAFAMTPELFSDLSLLSCAICPPETLPSPLRLWDQSLSDLRLANGQADIVFLLESNPFLKLISLLKVNEPRFLMAVGFPANFESDLRQLESNLLQFEVDEDSPLTDQRDGLQASLNSIKQLDLVGITGVDLENVRNHLAERIDYVEEQIDENRDLDDDDSEAGVTEDSEFNLSMVERVMDDLRPSLMS